MSRELQDVQSFTDGNLQNEYTCRIDGLINALMRLKKLIAWQLYR